jgi:hypothetical protein
MPLLGLFAAPDIHLQQQLFGGLSVSYLVTQLYSRPSQSELSKVANLLGRLYKSGKLDDAQKNELLRKGSEILCKTDQYSEGGCGSPGSHTDTTTTLSDFLL